MTTIANGKITTDKLYYFQNKAFPNFALNVWCSSKYPADELSNVCLWKFDKTDAAQKWYVRGNDYQCRICPLVGSSSLYSKGQGGCSLSPLAEGQLVAEDIVSKRAAHFK